MHTYIVVEVAVVSNQHVSIAEWRRRSNLGASLPFFIVCKVLHVAVSARM